MGGIASGGLYPTLFVLGAHLRLTHQPRHPFASDASPHEMRKERVIRQKVI
jgi:hypothetical protein